MTQLRRCNQKFPDWVDNEITKINTRWEATQRVMAAKLTRLAHKIAIQLHLVAGSCTICSSRCRRPEANRKVSVKCSVNRIYATDRNSKFQLEIQLCKSNFLGRCLLWTSPCSRTRKLPTNSGGHYYPAGTGGSCPGGKEAGACSWLLTSI
jgi:hypothetical protein